MKKHLIRTAVCLCAMLLLATRAYARADKAANIQTIYTYLTEEMRLNRAAACGILANIQYESNFNPESIGDSGNAYGICQWNSRRQSLINYCEENGFESWKSLEGQLGYLAHELETSKKSVGEFLKNVPDTAQGAYDAAYHFCVYFEIPANRYVKGNTRGTAAVNTYWVAHGGTVETYMITYDANGGERAPAPQTKREGIPMTVTAAHPTLKGYTHVGWSKTSGANRVDYEPGASLSENSHLTLYAVWERALEADTPCDASITRGGHTYEYYSGSVTWAYAQSFAAIKGGYLATVTSSSEYGAVRELSRAAEGDVWLGGRYSHGNWLWDSGEVFKDDFASDKWDPEETVISYGPNEYGRIAQTSEGLWKNVSPDSLECGGFIVEYGAWAEEEFPLYMICVDTSLRLREGPGTSYSTLSYMYSGTLVTIYDTCSVSGSTWGWGITDAGAMGWCAVKVPAYMIKASGVDAQTGLVYKMSMDGVSIIGFTGSVSALAIPETIGGYPVTEIAAGAFAGQDAPKAFALPNSVSSIARGAFKSGAVLSANVGSAAHAACANAGYEIAPIFPQNTLFLPSALTEIEEGAFEGLSQVECVALQNTGVTRVGKGAFSGMSALMCVWLPDTVEEIDSGAMDADTRAVLVVKNGSYACQWAQLNGFMYIALP